MQEAMKQVAVEEKESTSLMDCYRIALDFGMPAALKAYEKLALEPVPENTGSSINTD